MNSTPRSGREWSTDFCSLCAPPRGLWGYLYAVQFPLCAWADIEAGLERRPELRSKLWWEHVRAVLYLACVPFLCGGGPCGVAELLLKTRATMEVQYGIDNDGTGTCNAMMCWLCILTQMQNEMAIRKQAGGPVPTSNPISPHRPQPMGMAKY